MKERRVIYDFMELPRDPDIEWIDGSGEMLPEVDRMTEADREASTRLGIEWPRSQRQGPKQGQFDFRLKN